jgi:hypothetical protein
MSCLRLASREISPHFGQATGFLSPDKTRGWANQLAISPRLAPKSHIFVQQPFQGRSDVKEPPECFARPAQTGIRALALFPLLHSQAPFPGLICGEGRLLRIRQARLSSASVNDRTADYSLLGARPKGRRGSPTVLARATDGDKSDVSKEHRSRSHPGS